jgi:predicted nucleotidyltransferase
MRNIIMNNRKEKSLDEIKAEILRCLDEMGVQTKKIILFGSRARGDLKKSSDYDFLIITDKTFPVKDKMSICKKVNQALASLLIPSDIIVKSSEEAEYLKDQIGSVVREALKEGVEI